MFTILKHVYRLRSIFQIKCKRVKIEIACQSLSQEASTKFIRQCQSTKMIYDQEANSVSVILYFDTW